MAVTGVTPAPFTILCDSRQENPGSHHCVPGVSGLVAFFPYIYEGSDSSLSLIAERLRTGKILS